MCARRRFIIYIILNVTINNSTLALRVSKWRAQHERRAQLLLHNEFIDATCKAILQSSEAKLFENRIDTRKRNSALLERSISDEMFVMSGETLEMMRDSSQSPEVRWPRQKARRRNAITHLKSDSRWCDPIEFVPYIEDLGEIAISCDKICSSCLPGSTAYCRMKSPRYRGIAQWCLCSYDDLRPLEAAFAIRHSRGVIMPKLKVEEVPSRRDGSLLLPGRYND